MKQMSQNERLKCLIANSIKGVDAKAFNKNKNVKLAVQILDLIKEIK